MQENYTEFKEKFLALVGDSQNILITSHISPDDDSISSVLSVYMILLEKFPTKNIRIAYSNEPIVRYNVFKYFEKIEFMNDTSEIIDSIDLIIALDGNGNHRFTKTPEKFEGKKTICIDHHDTQKNSYTLALIDPKSPATAELIYKIFDGEYTLTKELAEIFLLGILGDTGNFRYLKPYQAETLSITKKLIDAGNIYIDTFQSTYSTISAREFSLIQVLIQNTKYGEITGWPAYQYTSIDRSTIEKGMYTDNEISAASHIYMSYYLRTITGYSWGFVITPRKDGGCRVSFRSLPQSVSVSDMAERMGIGGGHIRASGASFKMVDKPVDSNEAIAKIEAWMSTNAPVLE